MAQCPRTPGASCEKQVQPWGRRQLPRAPRTQHVWVAILGMLASPPPLQASVALGARLNGKRPLVLGSLGQGRLSLVMSSQVPSAGMASGALAVAADTWDGRCAWLDGMSRGGMAQAVGWAPGALATAGGAGGMRSASPEAAQLVLVLG